MGLFNRNQRQPRSGKPPLADQIEQAMRLREQAMRMQSQAADLQEQVMRQAAAFQQPGQPAQQAPGAQDQQAAPAGTGTASWARQVLAILAPPQPGFVKRCNCAVCGAPKQLPSVTAYVYCDYCASLIDFDLRRASEGDTVPGPGYATTVNSTHAAAQAAVAAGDRDGYLALQRQVYEAYVTHVPMAVSHRAGNDPGYRRGYVEYMAQAALASAFDPASEALAAEMRQRVMGLRYAGNMMSPTVAPESFWPVADTLERQIEAGQRLYRSAGLAELDPDRAGHLTGKLAWSGFCQGWLGMLPAGAAAELLDRAGLRNEYVPVRAEDGQPRHCGGCGGQLSALPGARAVVCDGCGRTIDVAAAEIPCTTCGASMTLPSGADEVTCPFCRSRVGRAGIR
jgi:DNA-directed RNA polymerase subunit RPC12/RpoP